MGIGDTYTILLDHYSNPMENLAGSNQLSWCVSMHDSYDVFSCLIVGSHLCIIRDGFIIFFKKVVAINHLTQIFRFTMRTHHNLPGKENNCVVSSKISASRVELLCATKCDGVVLDSLCPTKVGSTAKQRRGQPPVTANWLPARKIFILV